MWISSISSRTDARLDAQVVDQVRKRLQIDRDGHVDIPLTGPYSCISYKGLEVIDPSR